MRSLPTLRSCMLAVPYPRFIAVFLIALSLTSLAISLASLAGRFEVSATRPRTRTTSLPEHIARNLGPYSPYYRAGSYQPAPVGCEIDQVRSTAPSKTSQSSFRPPVSAGERLAATRHALPDRQRGQEDRCIGRQATEGDVLLCRPGILALLHVRILSLAGEHQRG